MTIRGIGTDVADIARIRRLLDRHGERFTARWFAPEEVARCLARRDPARAFSECFSAKEAVWKAIGAPVWSAPLAWREIVIDAGQARLRGRPAALAMAWGATRVLVATASDARLATAMAVATD